MAGRGRPAERIKLSGAEKKTLLGWARRHNSAQSLAMRSRIVLASAEGLTDLAVAEQVRCSPATVSKWRHRFLR